MTRQKDSEARICILIPKGLPQLPILPSELFGPSIEQCYSGELIGKPPAGTPKPPMLDRQTDCPIAGVTLKQRILYGNRLAAPQLRRDRPLDIRGLLRSSREWNPRMPCGPYRFSAIVFSHPVFTGRGEALLRWYGVPVSGAGYLEFLSRVWPEAAANYLLTQNDGAKSWRLRRCRADVRHLEQAALRMPPAPDPNTYPSLPFSSRRLKRSQHRIWRHALLSKSRDENWVEGWRALGGAEDEQARAPLRDPLAALLTKEDAAILASELARLPVQQARRLAKYFGLLGHRETSREEIAYDENISTSRISQQIDMVCRKLRHRLRWENGSGLVYRFARRRLDRKPARYDSPLELSR